MTILTLAVLKPTTKLPTLIPHGNLGINNICNHKIRNAYEV